MENLSDEQLVANYLKGDREALNFLIKRYLRPIFNYAWYFVKDTATAEDLTQEVFVKVWKKIKKFNTHKKFKNWLYAIAKNTALDYLKKNRAINFSALETQDGLLFEDLLQANSPSAQDELELALKADKVNSAVEKLPEKYREAVRLHYFSGYKFREIAQRFKESIETIKSRNRRALIYLKKILGK